MSARKIYICSALFLVLTVVRFSAPSLADRISDSISAALNLEREHAEAVIALGRSLADGGADEVIEVFLNAVMQDDTSPSPSPSAVPSPSPTPAPTSYPTAASSPTPEPEPTEDPAVSAFLASQEEYSDYAVPDTVSYDCPEIPFEYQSPVAGVTSSGFGYRLHPIQNEVKYHYGTDFAADEGTPISAFADGTIIAQGWEDTLGNYVVIEHEDGWRTTYAHCSELCMSCGSVSKGDTIALVGATGLATGSHLHFELKCGDVYFNPEFYV